MKIINIQKIFCFISILFITSCCIFYGTRFIKLYLENKKTETIEKNSLVKVLKENNSENDNFKSVNGQNYFTNNEESNYLLYSNILWRIIKVNSDNSLTVITDNAISSLAYGKELDFNNSHIFNWLNKTDKDLSGILENSLNEPETYLQKTTSCTDVLDEVSNNPCKEINTNNYISLLSAVDYLNVGSKESYLSNEENFYLSNTNSEKKIWYINDDGKPALSTGNDVIGIKPIITIKANIDYVDGDGTKESPYKIEKENALFGSYVKLDENIWRIYQVNENEVRLMLNDYLKVNGNNLTYKYSNINSYYDDYKTASIAYYLNHTFLNSLSYKDKIKEVYWSNGYYNNQTNFDYTNALKDEINTKVALMSIGNIFLNPELTNYYTMTGSTNKGSMVYTIQKSKKIYTKHMEQTINIVPTISLEKELLTKGNGTIDSPYEME